MDDDRKEVLIEIIEFLRENYVQYGRAIGYLEQLAGVRAMPRRAPEQLHFLLAPQAGIQRGAIVLGNLEPHTCILCGLLSTGFIDRVASGKIDSNLSGAAMTVGNTWKHNKVRNKVSSA